MDEISNPAPKRKVLSLKLAKQENNKQPRFVNNDESVYMVWCPQGDMPKRVYAAKERKIALSHAQTLCDETGKPFYVMRSWRAYEAAE